MSFYVYFLISHNKKRTISYVGYTKDLPKRIKLHNSSKGAKFTKGRKWVLIYSKRYKSKSMAMKEEYLLKKNRLLRLNIKKKYLLKKNA